MRKITILITLVVSVVGIVHIGSPAYAESVNMATVTRLMMDREYGEILFIQLDKSQSPQIECHTNNNWQYVLDTSDEIGKKYMQVY